MIVYLYACLKDLKNLCKCLSITKACRLVFSEGSGHCVQGQGQPLPDVSTNYSGDDVSWLHKNRLRQVLSTQTVHGEHTPRA